MAKLQIINTKIIEKVFIQRLQLYKIIYQNIIIQYKKINYIATNP